MTIPDPTSLTPEQVRNTGFSGQQLVEIVNARPDLAFVIQAHPNCPPELAAQLRQRDPGQQPPPIMDQSQAAPAGYVAQQPMVSGASGYRGAPTQPQSPAEAVKALWNSPAGTPSVKRWARRALALTPALGLLAVISLFLPAASVSLLGANMNISFMSAGGDAVILLVGFLAAAGLAVTTILAKFPWAPLATGATGVVAGALGLVDGFNLVSGVGAASEFGANVSIGFGGVLLILCSLAIVVAATLILYEAISSRR